MRLLRVHIISADTCGGLLDGLDIWLRRAEYKISSFDPLCLIGPNGAGKSQFLQVVAEMFQSVFHSVFRAEERVEGNPNLQFEMEYLIRPTGSLSDVHVRIVRKSKNTRKPIMVVEKKVDGEWIECVQSSDDAKALFPCKIVGYTSGDNETLSLPFLISRSGYAEEVGKLALSETAGSLGVPDTRLMLIDYGTHIEVLVANLVFGTDDQIAALLRDASLDEIHSFRCILQLAHSSAPKAPKLRKAAGFRKGIQLTEELEAYIDRLQRCATCYQYDDKTESYTFDFFANNQTKAAFKYFWKSALDLYSAFHKFSMLNDLAIPKVARERFKNDNKARRFATRLPEPQHEDKVFRFENVNFRAKGRTSIVDYVSLSDGEHQLTQILGTFCMISFPNVLFLLDEPESHFNPQWRVKFISTLMDLPTDDGIRRDESRASQQDCLLTTHAPFVPSDMQRDKVLIFQKDKEMIAVKRPDIETYGTTFDAILDECFGVRPPISELPRQDINELMISGNPGQIKAGLERLGHYVDKAFLSDRLRQLTKTEGE
jgi:restriction system-associated AAA family ATPase